MSFNFTIPEALLPKAIKFKEDEVVDWSQKSLKEQSEAEIIIDLAAELEIEPSAIFKHLKVNLGEIVKNNQTLAEKKTWFGGKSLKSPQTGEVRGINHENGTITLAIKQITNVPFGLKGKFIKKDKDNQLVFQVHAGMEVELQNSLETNFGGECVYVKESSDITIENCERKIVVSKVPEMMDQAKITALGPLAIISYEASYRDSAIPLLLIANRVEDSQLFAKKFPFCLYLMSKKTCLFYQP